MTTRKEERVADLIRDLAGEFINRESSISAMITVLRTTSSSDLKRMTILVSVFPSEEESLALDFLKRKRSEFRNYIKSHSKLRIIPFIDFEIDLGEKNRQEIERLSSGEK